MTNEFRFARLENNAERIRHLQQRNGELERRLAQLSRMSATLLVTPGRLVQMARHSEWTPDLRGSWDS